MLIVERALAENSALRKGIILQQLPRNYFSHLANLTVFYNTTLQQLVAASPSTGSWTDKAIVARSKDPSPRVEPIAAMIAGSGTGSLPFWISPIISDKTLVPYC